MIRRIKFKDRIITREMPGLRTVPFIDPFGNMICPKCFGTAENVRDTHYICQNSRKGYDKEDDCLYDNKPTQFKVVNDNYVHFPYNQMFIDRSTKDFYRKPYLQLENVGNDNINR